VINSGRLFLVVKNESSSRLQKSIYPLFLGLSSPWFCFFIDTYQNLVMMNSSSVTPEHSKKGVGDVERVGSVEIGSVSLVSYSLLCDSAIANGSSTDKRQHTRARRRGLDSRYSRLRQPSPSQPSTHSTDSFCWLDRSVRTSSIPA
jgi:hypothetical protein